MKNIFGEISSDEIDIEVGEIVNVQIYGRLNKASEKELKVGNQILKVENITKIEKV